VEKVWTWAVVLVAGVVDAVDVVGFVDVVDVVDVVGVVAVREQALHKSTLFAFLVWGRDAPWRTVD
jgi:hypothetical protein